MTEATRRIYQTWAEARERQQAERCRAAMARAADLAWHREQCAKERARDAAIVAEYERDCIASWSCPEARA